jgi:ribosomal-protein-alanine N-acetyltransferase
VSIAPGTGHGGSASVHAAASEQVSSSAHNATGEQSATSACSTRTAASEPATLRRAGLIFEAMCAGDLVEVERAERLVYAHPWSIGNFHDSLVSGYQCQVARDAVGNLIGYFLLMHAPDEAHLLNITLLPSAQGCGLGRVLIEQACSVARSLGSPAILLEVRPSNTHALAVYLHVGFVRIGVRKGYYPAAAQQREDAIVMKLVL